MRQIVTAFSQYELGLIRARTRAAPQAKKSRGERVGRIPLGWQLAADGVHLAKDPAEQATLRKVAELRVAGMSLRQIAGHLNGAGVLKRGGAPWNHVNLHIICSRPA